MRLPPVSAPSMNARARHRHPLGNRRRPGVPRDGRLRPRRVLRAPVRRPPGVPPLADGIRPRVANGPAASHAARARTSSSRSRSNTSVSSRTLPPQHWPRSGPSVRRSSTAPTPSRDSAPRAAPIACHSSSPPPMVPRKPPSGTMTMRAPGSRGAEPRTSATVTSAQRPCEATISATTDHVHTCSAPRAHRLDIRSACGPWDQMGKRSKCALDPSCSATSTRISAGPVQSTDEPMDPRRLRRPNAFGFAPG